MEDEEVIERDELYNTNIEYFNQLFLYELYYRYSYNYYYIIVMCIMHLINMYYSYYYYCVQMICIFIKCTVFIFEISILHS